MTMDMQQQRLIQVIEAYGANPERWPIEDRQLADLLGSEDEVTCLAEARLLDASLATAKSPDWNSDLQALILVKAAATPQIKAHAADDAPAEAKIDDFNIKALSRPARSTHQTSRDIFRLPEAAMLAASLLIGVWAGGSGLLETTLSNVDIALISQSEDETNLISALVGVTDADDEGLL